jgi:2-octaprenyl-6-methoxyphenol hydroxylase
MRVRITGSGPVALALALWLKRQGLPCEAIALELQDAPLPAALAGRTLALSLGSWQLLGRVCDPPPAAAIDQVDVSIDGHAPHLMIRAGERRVPALGYVVRYAALRQALHAATARAGLLQGAGIGEVLDRDQAPDPDELLVHAEGDPGTQAETRDFDQSALLAEVTASGRQTGMAFERFTSGGPLALLPLPQAGLFSLVWCDRPALTAERAALPPADLLAALQRAFGWSLGRFESISDPVVAPLVRRARRETVSASEVWIGNAAQTLHPVAGQGLNLGLRDAFELAQSVGDALREHRSVADLTRRHRRRRGPDRQLTIAITDALALGLRWPALAGAQSLVMGALDLSSGSRHWLADRFMFGLRR